MLIFGRTSVAKAVHWLLSDAKARKRGQQNGLDTRVVHAVNNGC